jgi:hypothetical protein
MLALIGKPNIVGLKRAYNEPEPRENREGEQRAGK